MVEPLCRVFGKSLVLLAKLLSIRFNNLLKQVPELVCYLSCLCFPDWSGGVSRFSLGFECLTAYFFNSLFGTFQGKSKHLIPTFQWQFNNKIIMLFK